MKKGFTLVELSIVLVIIGLLIGGILVGQSLIDSAKIQGQIRQIQQFDIATQQFQEKYKQFPGDSDLLTTAGDNDGWLEYDTTTNNYGSYFNSVGSYLQEEANIWKHLTDSGMLLGSYSNTPAAYSFPQNIGIGIDAPKSALNEDAIIKIISVNLAPSFGTRFYIIRKASVGTLSWQNLLVQQLHK